MGNSVRRRVGLAVAVTAAATGLLFGATGCHRVCHTGWTEGHKPGCVWVK